ncbi:molybdenum cofactor guanylyltransferase MobA [Microvirga puerhi]|uniref:Molybdenum cofactor guanylyltransferase n=1 Tax=Microvirga puerhi TaxID=2876078 RepID=A0ABS7VU01_9HYPH|nr:molybdenum cofactor guanylyltransferase MobA [Microvirga puerhi]
MHDASPFPPTLGVVLAGGRGTRMGGVDKALLALGGEPLLHRIVRRLGPQCDGLILNANGDAARFKDFGLPVVCDPPSGSLGPLSGILSGLDWAAVHRPDIEWIVSVSSDTPFVPSDLVGRLHEAQRRERRDLVLALSAGRLHPTIGLWSRRLRSDLRHVLVTQGSRSVLSLAERHGFAQAGWTDTPFDPFFNINTPEEHAMAELLLAKQQAEPTLPGNAGGKCSGVSHRS